MSDYYRLNPDHSVTPIHAMEWIADSADRRVAETVLPNGLWVSTVFLGLDHQFLDGNPPLIFESMGFESENNLLNTQLARYSTWDEAVAGHQKMVDGLMAEYGLKWPAPYYEVIGKGKRKLQLGEIGK